MHEFQVFHNYIINKNIYIWVSLSTDFSSTFLNFNEYFFKELDILQEFKKDKLCKITKNKIILTDTGKHFSEIVASIFDRYSKTERYKNIII